MAKKEGGATVTVIKKGRAKQDDLPGVEASSRRIAELEDLSDTLIDAKDAADSAKEKVKEGRRKPRGGDEAAR